MADRGGVGGAGQGFRGGGVERQPGVRAGGVEGGAGGAAHAGAGEIDQPQPGPGAALHRDHREIGGLAIRHRAFFSRDPPVRGGRGEAARVGGARAFGEGEGGDLFPGGEGGEPARLLVGAGVKTDRFGAEADRGGPGERGEGAADFLAEDAQRQMAETGAAVLFGQGCADPAHAGDVGPEGAVEAGAGFEGPADGGGGTAVGQEAAGFGAELLEFVGEIEVHAVRSLGPAVGWRRALAGRGGAAGAGVWAVGGAGFKPRGRGGQAAPLFAVGLGGAGSAGRGNRCRPQAGTLRGRDPRRNPAARRKTGFRRHRASAWESHWDAFH